MELESRDEEVDKWKKLTCIFSLGSYFNYFNKSIGYLWVDPGICEYFPVSYWKREILAFY